MFKVFILTLSLIAFTFAQVKGIEKKELRKQELKNQNQMERWMNQIRAEQSFPTPSLTFEQLHKNLVDESIQAVKRQYNPPGFHFSQIVKATLLSIQEAKYSIIAEFVNFRGQQQRYEVVLYEVENMGMRQVISCKQLKFTKGLGYTQSNNHLRFLIDNQARNKSKILAPEQQFENGDLFNYWVKQNSNEYLKENNKIVFEAVLAVDAQMRYQDQNESSRYYYQEVIEVYKHVDDGTDYIILLKYGNKLNETATHQVVIQSPPWNDKLVSQMKISYDYKANGQEDSTPEKTNQKFEENEEDDTIIRDILKKFLSSYHQKVQQQKI